MDKSDVNYPSNPTYTKYHIKEKTVMDIEEVFGILFAGFLLLALLSGLIVLPIISLLKINNLEKKLNLLHLAMQKNTQSAPVDSQMPADEKSAAAVADLSTPQTAATPMPKSESAPAPAPAPIPQAIPFPIANDQKTQTAEILPAAEKTSVAPIRPATSMVEKTAEEKAPAADREVSPLNRKLENISSDFNDKLESLEQRSAQLLNKLWSWFCVGEEYRSNSVSREYAVATTWLIRLGVVILLCGIGFFLKYSIDRNWTPPAVRVILMLLAGMAMAIFGSWKSKGKYRPLAIALAGAGFVTLYLSIMAAYKLYDLIPVTLAFGGMIAVTASAMTAALSTNAMFTALLGCAGGYLTPVFISTGSNNIIGLFIYMAILAAGTLLTAYYRNWMLLNLISFTFYAIIGAAAPSVEAAGQSPLAVIGLLALNFVIFSLQQTAAASKRDLTIPEILLTAANTAFYFIMVLPTAEKYYANWQLPALCAVFAAIIAIGEIMLVVSKFRRKPTALLSTLQLKLCFALILAIPLLLSDVWIIAAWSVMALLITEAALKHKSPALLVIGITLYAVTALREIVAPSAFAQEDVSYWISLLNHLLTAGVYTACLSCSAVRLIRNAPNFAQSPDQSTELVRGIGSAFAAIAAVIFFLYSSYEISQFCNFCCQPYRYAVLVIYWSALTVLLLKVIRQCSITKLIYLVIWLLILSGIWLLSIKTPAAYRSNYPAGLLYTLLTAGSYIAALLVTAREFARSDEKNQRRIAVVLYSAAGILFFVYSSVEWYEFLECYLKNFRNGGLSVYWSILAFILLWRGVTKQQKTLRMCAIALFGAVALKIFFIDLAQLEQIWRIAAFALIGVIMLIGAVTYIRCKDLFIQKGDE
ncbi:MAG: DUF2339 domain-containing protein [Lentisphaerae bacterium]|nr:DUF2339 domain-containing protein [Lentisphaerota bacterium]